MKHSLFWNIFDLLKVVNHEKMVDDKITFTYTDTIDFEVFRSTSESRTNMALHMRPCEFLNHWDP